MTVGETKILAGNSNDSNVKLLKTGGDDDNGKKL